MSRLAAMAAAFAAAFMGAVARGQQDNPVYVDDSPRAWELFQTARDQARGNAGEAVRLYRELLDDYGMKLLPVSAEARDRFVAVRARVLEELAGDEQLLERFRLAETAEAQRLLDAGELERVAMTRSLTEPGLEALLRLGQTDLESGRFHSALGRLTHAAGHPDLAGRRAAHCWYMIGVAASYLSSRPDEVARAAAALDALGDDGAALRRRLDEVTAMALPPLTEGVTPLDEAGAHDLDQLVAQPIWSVRLDDSPLRLTLADPLLGDPGMLRQADSMRRSGEMLTSAPTVAGNAVYVNEGGTIHGVDRFTGRPLWAPHVARQTPGAVETRSRQIADLNIVAVSGDTLVTLTGHAYADQARSERTMVCLDVSTGEMRWSRRIDRLTGTDELEGLFPHGAPVIGEGLVYVAARRVSRQLLTSCYVIALDLADGRLVWVRHVASSGGIRTRFARPFSSLVSHGGDLAVATSIGAVARIDAATGETRWLHRYNPPLSPFLAERRPWEVTSPVVTSRGLVAIRPDSRRIVLLDWETGQEIEDVSATAPEAWNSPRYLLADDERVYGIGGDVRAFRLDDLQRPLWVLSASGAGGDARPGIDSDPLELRGRVQLVRGGLIVPTDRGLLVVEGASGRILHRVDVETPGNPLATESQLILAAADELQAYMPMARAEQMLRRQIAGALDDPGPALALMRLGVRVRDLGLSLEAANLAIGAIDRAGPGSTGAARQELFDVLLELDAERIARTVEQGEALHAMIGLVAQEPHQRVRHLLAYGDWLSAHSLGRAVESYQTILSTPPLPGTRLEVEGVARPAADWASRRIEALVAAQGEGVYRPQADFARMRLGRLRRGPRPDPEALVALATEFPFAPASAEAAVEAARIFASGGDVRRALEVLMRAYRMAPDRQRAETLLGPYVALAEQAGWTSYASSVLGAVLDAYGDMMLATDGGRRDAANWLESLRAATAARRPPLVGGLGGDLAIARRVTGTLVPLHAGTASIAVTDRALIYDPPQLVMLSATLDPLWRMDLDLVGQPSLLRFDLQGLLLWIDAPGDDGRAMMIDPDLGEVRWTSASVAGPGGLLGAAVIGPELVRRGEQVVDPDELLPLVAGDRLVLARRSGEIVAIDQATGAVQWRRPPAEDVPGVPGDAQPLAQVDLIAAHDTGIILAGVRREGDTGDVRAALVILDPRTGRTMHHLIPLGGTAVRWMDVTALGALVYGNATGIESVDLVSGLALWSNRSLEVAGAGRGWIAGDSLVVESPMARPGEGPNPLRAVRLRDGGVTPPFDAPARGDWDRLDLREVVVEGGRIFARYGKRIIRFDRSGTVLGADVISDQRDYKWLLPAADRLLLVSRFKSEQVMVPGAGRRQAQQVYRIYSLSANCRLIGEAIELPSMSERLGVAAVIDGWLLLSGSAETYAVGLPVDEPVNRP